MKQVTKGAFTGSSFICLVTAILLLSVSCGNNSDKKKSTADTSNVVINGDTTRSAVTDTSSATDVNCVTLTNAQVSNVWVTLGYTRPRSAGSIDSIRFRSEKNGSTLTVYATGATAAHAVIANSQIILAQGFNCGNDIPTTAEWGPNQVKLADLGILTNTGGVTDFIYIRMTPEMSSNNVNVRYKMDVVDAGGNIIRTVYSDPCPPLCPIGAAR